MKDLATELLFKVLRTPSVVEQIKKSLVNRDIVVSIDGKDYQILKKNKTEYITELKAENWDLKKALSNLVISVEESIKPENMSKDIIFFISEAKTILGK